MFDGLDWQIDEWGQGDALRTEPYAVHYTLARILPTSWGSLSDPEVSTRWVTVKARLVFGEKFERVMKTVDPRESGKQTQKLFDKFLPLCV